MIFLALTGPGVPDTVPGISTKVNYERLSDLGLDFLEGRIIYMGSYVNCKYFVVYGSDRIRIVVDSVPQLHFLVLS